MSFITGIIASVLEWALTNLWAFMGKEYSIYKADEAVKSQVADDLKQLQNAKTALEKQNAASKINNDTFHS